LAAPEDLQIGYDILATPIRARRQIVGNNPNSGFVSLDLKRRFVIMSSITGMMYKKALGEYVAAAFRASGR
jgi:hypothetical protein